MVALLVCKVTKRNFQTAEHFSTEAASSQTVCVCACVWVCVCACVESTRTSLFFCFLIVQFNYLFLCFLPRAADHAARHPGADASQTHSRGRRGHPVLQVQTVLQRNTGEVHIHRWVHCTHWDAGPLGMCMCVRLHAAVQSQARHC